MLYAYRDSDSRENAICRKNRKIPVGGPVSFLPHIGIATFLLIGIPIIPTGLAKIQLEFRYGRQPIGIKTRAEFQSGVSPPVG